MHSKKALVSSVAALVIATACAAAFCWVVQSRDAWLVKSVIDRAAPWEAPTVSYAQTPEAESYFQSYNDASGAYKNYVYEIQLENSSETAQRVVLVSFGTMLDESKPFIKMSVKGSSVCAWEYAETTDE